MLGAGAVLVAALLAGAQSGTSAAPASAIPQQTPSGKTGDSIAVPAGTKVEMALVRPVWAYSASPGIPIYAETTFPVIADGRVAIPAGTYVQGTIEKVTRPNWRKHLSEIQILFTKIILANGYTVEIPGAMSAVTLPNNSIAATQADRETSGADLAATRMEVSVQVFPSNDVLLDNGAVIEMTLGSLLALDAAQVAADIPISRAPVPGQFVSASRCRPTAGYPGTPGTPDTVIPGSPGTPDTVIPGGPGMPDTVIPGTPATPDTVIPGTPGTPGLSGTACPSPPVVISCTPVTVAGAAGKNSQPPAKR